MEEIKKNRLDEGALENVAGGAGGDATQIKVGPGGSGGWYVCPRCGNMDFYIIASGPNYVQIRCKNCNQVSQVSQA